MARSRFRESESRPWGFVSALLMSAFVTLVGIVHGLEPLTILQRAALASAATGIAVSVIVGVSRPLLSKKWKTWQR